MAKLTTSQKIFLEEKNIPISAVFDATGLSKQKYGSIMRDLDKVIAYGVTECGKAGHIMRTRSGHCVQCNTAVIAFQSRRREDAYVYVAGSLQKSR